MKSHSTLWRRAALFVGLIGLACSVISFSPALAASASTRVSTSTCSGTGKAPGSLTGTYAGNVTVKGVCLVDAGKVVVKGNLTIAAGAALNATFGLNDTTKKGYSNLTVDGNVSVGKKAVLGMGCDPTNSPCSDDPHPKSPTLSSWDWVHGSLTATDALGVILHNSFIGQSLTETGGGGGVNCTPTGIFVSLGSPVFSDFENVVVGGNFSITGLKTCWLGALRDDVRGDFTDSNNTFADPDADEVNSNYVGGSLACAADSPAVQYGDAPTESPVGPNVVVGHASGACSFQTLKPDPAPKGTLQHISVSAAA